MSRIWAKRTWVDDGGYDALAAAAAAAAAGDTASGLVWALLYQELRENAIVQQLREMQSSRREHLSVRCVVDEENNLIAAARVQNLPVPYRRPIRCASIGTVATTISTHTAS